MVMVASLMQGSYTTSTLRPVSWDKGIELKRFGRTVHMFTGTNRFSSLSCEPSFLSAGAAPLRGPKTKSLRISGFKGGVQNEESRDRASGSKLPENSAKCSYLQQGSEETLIEFPEEQEVPLSCGSEEGQMIARSLTIQKLVKNWLTLFTTRPQNQAADGSLKEPDSGKELLLQNGSQKIERGEILKAVWCYLWSLDVTVKIPLLIFIPFYLAVNVVYGAEVSNELIPLWVLGPLIVMLYIKALRALCKLYVFVFKRTVEVVKNSPSYYAVARSYIISGRLKEGMRILLGHRLVDMWSLDCKDLLKRMTNALQDWAGEKYLDFVESIWPFYCRSIRFLKRANLI